MKKSYRDSFSSIFRSFVLIAVVACLSLTGCESKLKEPEQLLENATVSGTVTLDGKPVGQGAISFFSLQFGVVGKAALDSDGKFTFSEPLSPGEYNVFFVPEDGKTLKGIPQKYLIETSSDHSVTVEENDNQLTIDLKS